MERKSKRSYLFFFLALLALLSIPKTRTEILRSSVVACTNPLWNNTLKLKNFFKDPIGAFKPSLASINLSAEQKNFNHQLEVENEQLKQTIRKLELSLSHEWEIESELLQIIRIDGLEAKTNAFYQRRQEELIKLVENQLQSFPAKVIFRDPASWSNSLWIDVGYEDNNSAGRRVISKNSPVVVGLNVVGLIDYVGRFQSRVRLITDPGLNPSVRSARNFPQDLLLREKIYGLVHTLNIYPCSQLEKTSEDLMNFSKNFPLPNQFGYFAKGELKGSDQGLWRSKGNMLRGVGFNMDYSDEEGPARDLRTGATPSNKSPVPILMVGDILVTTGMDGIFPPGLRMAEVVKIETLREGSYTYDLVAKPLIPNLAEIEQVFVIPPIGYDEDDKPQPYLY